jgi:L-asparaginase
MLITTKKPIRIFITGGTIDCDNIEARTGKYIFTKTHLSQMLDQGRTKLAIYFQRLMLKDSALMTDEDRKIILENCQSCEQKRIVITHGTDSMVQTATVLAHGVKRKTIVLTGSIIPYNKKISDAMFNLGTAIAAVQLLPHGVFISMNGKIFPWNNVMKNPKLGIFEELH